ncbi:MAG: polyhydroxyalkanoate synthesis regulator DNA-binding domain-containing protein [Deltaproteobacteria bacterium]|nr:polyhydroxyalkanoate synthesis regulator DNA-binding domain-containing protein [Deltaproteobacteria bacterium]
MSAEPNSEAPSPSDEPIPAPTVKVIKRYTNRKLYDTEMSRYVTLEEIATMIKAGDEVQIVDNRSNRDLTAITLTQIIYETEKRKSHMPLGMLRELIQNPAETLEELLERSPLKTPVADLKSSAEKGIEEIKHSAIQFREAATRSFSEWTEGARRLFTRSEPERLAKKIDEAVKKLDPLIDDLHAKTEAQLRAALPEDAKIVAPIVEHISKKLKDLELMMAEIDRAAEQVVAEKPREPTDSDPRA